MSSEFGGYGGGDPIESQLSVKEQIKERLKPLISRDLLRDQVQKLKKEQFPPIIEDCEGASMYSCTFHIKKSELPMLLESDNLDSLFVAPARDSLVRKLSFERKNVKMGTPYVTFDHETQTSFCFTIHWPCLEF